MLYLEGFRKCSYLAYKHHDALYIFNYWMYSPLHVLLCNVVCWTFTFYCSNKKNWIYPHFSYKYVNKLIAFTCVVRPYRYSGLDHISDLRYLDRGLSEFGSEYTLRNVSLSISFQIEWNTIVVAVFLLIMNLKKVRLVRNSEKTVAQIIFLWIGKELEKYFSQSRFITSTWFRCQ